jgi:dipeptidyl aminopeptidase/acylaminoacyl peptidase
MHLRSLAFAAALAVAANAADDPLATRLRALVALGSAESPSPSSDGTHVAFVTTLFGSRQVATMPVDGGYPVELTAEPGGIVTVQYSPADPHELAVVALRDGKRRVLLLDDQGAPAVEADPAPGEQMLGGFARDGRRLFVATAGPSKGRLALVDVESRRVAEIGAAPQSPAPPAPAPVATPIPSAPPPRVPPEHHAVPPPPGIAPPQRPAVAPSVARAQAAAPAVPGGEVSRPLAEVLESLSGAGAPSPDGRTVLVQTTRDRDENVWSVDVATGTATLLTGHQGRARFREPRWHPDGRSIYVLTDAGRQHLGVDTITLATRERKPLYAPDRGVEAFAVTADGHRVAVAEEAGGQTVFGLLELPSLRAQPLPQPPQGAIAPGESRLAWTRTGERLFFAWRQAQDTTDVFVFRVGFGTMLRLTHSPRPELPRHALPRAYPRTVGNSQAFLWRPAGPARPRLAVFLAGGEARPVLDRRIAALAAVEVAALEITPRDAQGRLEQGEAAVPELLAAIRSAAHAPDLDAAHPLLVATGDGTSQAELLLRRAPDLFAGAVTIDSETRVPGAVHVTSLAELVRAAKDKLR